MGRRQRKRRAGATRGGAATSTRATAPAVAKDDNEGENVRGASDAQRSQPSATGDDAPVAVVEDDPGREDDPKRRSLSETWFESYDPDARYGASGRKLDDEAEEWSTPARLGLLERMVRAVSAER